MMELREIIAEVEAAANQEAAGISLLETMPFEPELGRIAGSCLAAARKRAEALALAARLLRNPVVVGFPGLPGVGARP